jgi:hypothetical protein
MASKAPPRTPNKKLKPSSAGKTGTVSSKRKPRTAPRGEPARAPSAPGARPATVRTPVSPGKQRPVFVPRAMASHDDDDVLMAHGGGGAGFGRCGGRLLSSKIEQQLCNRLGIAGVVHSHSPRHYEVRFAEGLVAAYAPQIVLRGRGREGKSVVVEAIEEAQAPILKKIIAFREQYGQEFYVILVAADEILDEVPLAAYDESCSSTNVNTLIARLAE